MNQKQLCASGVPLSVARDLMLVTAAIILFSAGFAQAQAGRYTKTVVSDHIRKVEDGVDEFRDYLEKRGENARDQAQSGQSSGTRTRRGGASSGNTEARKEQAGRTKDELDDALGDLNRSTNRLAPQIRSHFELHGDAGADGKRDGIGTPGQPGDGSRKIRHTTRALLGGTAGSYQ